MVSGLVVQRRERPEVTPLVRSAAGKPSTGASGVMRFDKAGSGPLIFDFEPPLPDVDVDALEVRKRKRLFSLIMKREAHGVLGWCGAGRSSVNH